MAVEQLPVCVLNDTRVDLHHGCDRVMGAIGRLLDLAGMRIVATSAAHVDWSASAGFLRELSGCRLVVVNGEGTLHDDRPAARRLLEVGAFAKSLGIPAVLVNAGWERNGPELARLTRDFALVAARDESSARSLREAGCDCVVAPDLSLYLPIDAAAASATRRGIGFTDSVDRFKTLALNRCRRAVGGQTVSILYRDAGAAGYLRFLRGSIGRDDARTPKLLVELLAARHALSQVSTRATSRFLDHLARLELVVSGRFHACTLALGTATPFVAVPSNTGKIAALVADAGLEPWRAETQLAPEAVYEAARRGWSAREQKSIADYVRYARTRAEELFGRIRTLA